MVLYVLNNVKPSYDFGGIIAWILFLGKGSTWYQSDTLVVKIWSIHLDKYYVCHANTTAQTTSQVVLILEIYNIMFYGLILYHDGCMGCSCSI